MKINRTFSIDYSLVLELKKKPNQSNIVCRALRLYFSDDEDTLQDMPIRRLMAALSARKDCDDFLSRLLREMLNE